MKVLHITEAAAGGVQTHLAHILPGLRTRGVELDLIYSPCRQGADFENDTRILGDSGCGIFCYPFRRGLSPLHDPAAFFYLRRIFRERSPDVIHLHATKAGFLGRLAFGSSSGPPIVYSPHSFCFEGMSHSRPGWAASVLVERLLRSRTDRYVFVSEAEAEVASRRLGLSQDRYEVVENSLPPDFLENSLCRSESRRILGIADDELAICLPGRVVYQKGQDWFLEALSLLEPERIPFRVYICGEGSGEERLKRISAARGLGRFITWLGFVPGLGSMMRAFDLVVLVSRYEALSYVLLETLASEVPVIVSEIDAHFPRESLRALITAVPLDDPVALAETLERIPGSIVEMRGHAGRAAEIVRNEFKFSRQLDGLERCYREVLGS